jgi:tripartite-type tricarboxylate transporter receptor subunit TctC
MTTTRVIALVLACSAGFAASPALSQDFYKGKTIDIVVGSAAGGGYDAYARLLSRHMPRHIAGTPAVVVRNMPGAAGGIVTSWLANVAPKDGTAIAAPLNTVPLMQLLDPDKFQFKSGAFKWLGAPAAPTDVMVTYETSGVKTLEDATRKEINIGATTPGTTMEIYPRVANSLFGTKFKVVTGYQGGAELIVAMERGEVQGIGGNTYQTYNQIQPTWIRDGKINLLFQVTLSRDPAIPNTPSLMEFAKNDEQRQIINLLATSSAIGRPLMAPPATPDDRVDILRKAMADAIQDPALIAEANKARLELRPVSGVEMQKMVETMMSTPREIVEKYKAIVAARN